MEFDVDKISEAIVQHDADAVAEGLAMGLSPNAVASNNQCFLETALECGDVPILAQLLSAGADIHQVGYDTNIEIIDDVMIDACHEDNPVKLGLLLEAGMSPDALVLNLERRTTLLMMASFTSYDVVQFLISSGATINAQDSEGWTPLMYASAASEATCSYRESAQIVHYLMQHGADPSIKSSKGLTAFDISQHIYDVEARQEIMKYLGT